MSVQPVVQPDGSTAGRSGRLRCSPVPIREPRPASRVDQPGGAGQQLQQVPGQAPLMLVLPSCEAPVREAAPATRIEDHAAGGGDRTGIYPEPCAWAARFVVAALEVSHGVRPAEQLVRWTSPEVHATLARRAGLATRLRPSAPAGLVSGALKVLRVRSCEPAPAICELAVVVRDRGRIRAAALRLEGLGNRWRVTALQIG